MKIQASPEALSTAIDHALDVDQSTSIALYHTVINCTVNLISPPPTTRADSWHYWVWNTFDQNWLSAQMLHAWRICSQQLNEILLWCTVPHVSHTFIHRLSNVLCIQLAAGSSRGRQTHWIFTKFHVYREFVDPLLPLKYNNVAIHESSSSIAVNSGRYVVMSMRLHCPKIERSTSA